MTGRCTQGKRFDIRGAFDGVWVHGKSPVLGIGDTESLKDRTGLGGNMKPKIVCLCGSTRFTREMLIKQWEFTKQGYIVLTWCALPDDCYLGENKAHIGDQEGVEELFDEIHKRKIDLADEVFILNVNGYIGESTRSEIDYAIQHGKPVRYLEA